MGAKLMVGKGFNVTVTVAVPVHPESVPVTVYVVVLVGATLTVMPLNVLGIHVYVAVGADELAVSVDVPFGHTPKGAADAVMTRFELTATDTKPEPVQPPVNVMVTV